MCLNIDAVVAGAGIWGCTVARRLAEAGRRVLILEKRSAVGGNCRCEIDAGTGIEIHTYGSHIFHTSDEGVWRFVRRFTAFNDYRHRVLAKTRKTGAGGGCARTEDGFRLYHLPIGRTLLKEFFGREMRPGEMTGEERAQLFDAFIRGYTSKQWGVAPEKVDPSVIARLKVRDSDSTDYFDDPHQGIPADGYNRMFERMLEHPNITVQCGCELALEGDEVKVRGEGEAWIQPLFSKPSVGDRGLPIYCSAPIDALFGYRFGALPWRTLNFERETVETSDYQGNSVVNYTDADVPYTRIHEFRHYHPDWPSAGRTVIMREYSAAWRPGDEPYYPVSTAESAARLARYREEVEKFNLRRSPASALTLGGRLGLYRYLDMDKSIASALDEADALGVHGAAAYGIMRT